MTSRLNGLASRLGGNPLFAADARPQVRTSRCRASTGSAVIALTTAAVNLLSAGAAFGVLALVFQHSRAEGLLGFHSTGAVVNWIPPFTFAVLFGLSMAVDGLSGVRGEPDPGGGGQRHVDA